jgi:hypothetical protein
MQANVQPQALKPPTGCLGLSMMMRRAHNGTAVTTNPRSRSEQNPVALSPSLTLVGYHAACTCRMWPRAPERVQAQPRQDAVTALETRMHRECGYAAHCALSLRSTAPPTSSMHEGHGAVLTR